MAQRTVVTLTCDMPHRGSEVDASETLAFAFDGTSYEMDVCETDATRLRDAFTKYTQHARNTGGGKITAMRRVQQKPTTYPQRDVRNWAAQQGIKVSNRGKIPNTVVEQYAQAQHA